MCGDLARDCGAGDNPPALRPSAKSSLGITRRQTMKADRNKYKIKIRNTDTGEVLAVADMTQARARALVKAYRSAGIFAEVAA